MTNTRLELCNMIRMEAEHVSDTGFPLDVFPQAVQSVILDMDRYENYKTEFIATAMLSAVSAALGGTYRIRIKGEWQSNAALYIILVGRPGLGKTPPLEAAYRPIRKHDYALFKAYESELEAWKAAGESGRKPVLRRTVVSDFTPESLLLTHNNNPRSVVILVDEIMGMFNSANRYTNGQLIEQLLTAWSGGALDVTRVGSTVPVHIEQPCINIIGTTQTKRIHELLTKGFEENGLLDRILFVLPKSREVPKWTDWDDGGEDRASMAAARWEQILGKVLSLDYDTGEEERMPHVLVHGQGGKGIFLLMVEQESGTHQPDRGRRPSGEPRDEASGASGTACPAHAGAAVCRRGEPPAVCGYGIGESRHPAEQLLRGLVLPHPLIRGGRHVRGTAQGAAVAAAGHFRHENGHRHWKGAAECQRAHGDELPQGAVPEQAAAEVQGRALREDHI